MRPSRRNELVEQALKIFNRNGYQASGMDLLALETGISKTSMYKYFRTKEDLILAVLELRDQKLRDWMFVRIAELADTPAGQLLALFDVLREWFAQPDFCGCMFMRAAGEYGAATHPIHLKAAEHKETIVRYLADLAIKANADRPEQLARQLMLVKEGATVSAQLGYAKDPAGDARVVAKALIEKATGQAIPA
ncbi:TetR/AcrR family transcriptional regulator [Sneathiella limimaris]|uniref:TetR/AcrR family transcriptional regulator n=1 Tax=Sneathiella limimaris TaxID=1964213 RepID=UPI00146C25A5|nr:TetR family transcriptional regulator [Sneathiella limimaris]